MELGEVILLIDRILLTCKELSLRDKEDLGRLKKKFERMVRKNA